MSIVIPKPVIGSNGPISGTVAVSNLPSTQSVQVVSLPLAPDASTSTAQLETTTAVSTLSNKLPSSLGPKSTVASLSVTPTSDGFSIANTSFGITGTLPPFSTTPTFNLGTAPAIQLAAGTNVIGSISNTSFAATQSGSWNVGINNIVAVTGTFFQATQPVSATTLPLPNGAATSSGQSSTNTAIELLAKLTDTQPISVTSLPLPNDAATASNQSILSSKFPTSLGPKTSANSLAVVFPTDQATLSTSLVSLPAFATTPTFNLGVLNGAATSANQDLITAAITLQAKLTDAQPISATSLPLPTGAATQSTLASLLAAMPSAASIAAEIDLLANPTTKYSLANIDDALGYYGYLDRNGNWYINKITSTDSTYAKGSSSYSTAWTSRATQNYTTFDITF